MANPTVEKLKEAGLRYGDKVAVALTSLLFVVCLGLALSKKSIDITPDQVKKAAEVADTNINRHQETETTSSRSSKRGASSPPVSPRRSRSRRRPSWSPITTSPNASGSCPSPGPA